MTCYDQSTDSNKHNQCRNDDGMLVRSQHLATISILIHGTLSHEDCIIIALTEDEGGEDDYEVLRHVGEIRDFAAEGFTPKDHLDIAEGLDAVLAKGGLDESQLSDMRADATNVRALLAVITDRSVGYSVALHNDRAHALRRRDEAINEAARLANALARVEKLADQWEATAVYGPRSPPLSAPP